MNQELDQWCEELIREEFGESCNFDVDDAVQKLEKLGIVTKVRFPYKLLSLVKYIIMPHFYDLFSIIVFLILREVMYNSYRSKKQKIHLH